jgi:Rrf2 family protein
MRISAKVEDACLAMIELAANCESGRPVQVGTVAEAHGLSQRFLVQILLELKSAGLVTSVRGAKGGYQLARRPDEISLADVINAIDGSALAPVRRISPQRRAPVATSTSPSAEALQSVWRDLHAEQVRLLNATTFADLLRRSRQESLSYQI